MFLGSPIVCLGLGLGLPYHEVLDWCWINKWLENPPRRGLEPDVTRFSILLLGGFWE